MNTTKCYKMAKLRLVRQDNSFAISFSIKLRYEILFFDGYEEKF